ncbi:MAG: ferritin family protein [Candidatus Aenigmatarchaeota archaeon]
MLSERPIKIEDKDVEKQILRLGIIAELDAINLYEQLAAKTEDQKIKKVLLDVAKEEKTHVGEFLSLLLEIDKEQKEELKKGEEEIKEKLSKE